LQEFLNKVIHGDCLEELKKLPDNSIDSVVTDPPYGLSKEPDIVEVLTKWINDEPYNHGHKGFLGKSWDSFVPHPDIWKEVYRVLKPGGHILCFSGTRTQDLMTISLRLAGFEIRDVIEWIYFSGFPKSADIGKALNKRGKKDLSLKWDGWGSGLKPSHEPIILCRKPIEKTIVDNIEKYGTGGLNIDGCRVKVDDYNPKKTKRSWYIYIKRL
jgi:site-specific DNA-methyltransferase (adenine-specific)